MTLLEVKNLCKQRESFCLQDVALSVDEGEMVGLVGANGAGKTTLIKTVMGLVKPTSGQIKLFGQDATQGLAPALKQDIGVVLDSCSFPDDYVLKDISILMKSAWANWDEAEYFALLKKFQLDENAKVKTLSRGMGMKVSLACTLAHKPKLLLLDEATAGLDPLARDELLESLRAYLNETGAGMLLATHITSDLEQFADKVVCLDGGKQVFSVCREEITDMAGIARCGEADLAAILESSLFQPGTVRVERRAYNLNVLVPDRFAFMKEFPDVACDHASIEEYMRLMMKGETK